MELKIEIFSTDVIERKGISAKGKPYTLREQEAFAHTFGTDGKPERYPRQIVVTVPDGQSPYAVGSYSVGPSSFEVGEYGRLRLGRLHLETLAKPGVRAA